MTGMIAVRNSIRDFLRKYDEVVTPIIRFIFSFIMFSCINSLFGYSEFLHRGVITFLLSVISALVTGPVVVFLAGVVVAVHCFSVSMDIGVLCLLLFLIMYCAYIRMFQNTGYVLALVPILYMLKIPFAAPVMVAIFAGFSGAVPAAFGVVIYYFSQYVKEARATILLGEDADFQGYSYVVNGLMKDKVMLLAVIAFAIVVMVTSLIHQLNFDYAWYVAIGVGSVFTILVFLICGMMVDVSVPAGSLVLGAILGGVLGVVVQMCKSVIDYSHKESVQFEDDDYYYYVKAIPKVGEAQRKLVKTMTDEDVVEEVKKQPRSQQSVNSQARQSRPQQGANGQARQPRPQQSANGQARQPRPQQGTNGQARQPRPQQGENSQARQPRPKQNRNNGQTNR